MTPHLHTEEEYLAICETRNIVRKACDLLECPTDEFSRMLAGLCSSIAIMHRIKVGHEVADAEISSLPKRYRKSIKRMRAPQRTHISTGM